MVYKKIIEFLNFITSAGGHAPTSRFLRYSVWGTAFTVLDFIILIILKEFFGLLYLTSITISFIMTTFLNYVAIRKWGFHETQRKFARGFVYYFGINLISLVMLSLLVFWMVENLSLNYLVARFFAGILVGLLNFALNSKFAFNLEIVKNG
ncbi:GtrA family protein [Candidatus Pacearchaeota archaeon]|nr:GtrA family protein [Candidatus Pacearchaeota archaeon]